MLTGGGVARQSVFTLGDHPPRAIFSGGAFWKWFFHPQAKLPFKTLWDYLLLYLEDIANFQPVQLEVSSEFDVTGAYLEAEISVRDLDNRIIPAAELRAWQEFEEGENQALDLVRHENGKYSTILNTKFAGEFFIIAEAFRFGELWGRDTSRIELMSFNSENQAKGVDHQLLSRLAGQSGGKVIQIGQNDLPAIPMEYYLEKSTRKLGGVRSPVVFVILVTLFILEWIIRRRNGLL